MIFLLCLFLLFPSISFAAFVEVGGGSQTRSCSTSYADTFGCDYPGDVTNGNFLIMSGFLYGSGNISKVGITDTVKTSYSLLAVDVGSGYIRFIAYGFAPASGPNTVTVDPSDNDAYMSLAIDEFSGAAVVPLDVDAGSFNGTGSSVSEIINTLTDNALIVALYTDDSGFTGTITETGGLTKFGEQENGGCCVRMATGFKVVGTAGAYTASWTLADSVTAWQVYLASFKPAAVSPPTIVRRRAVVVQ